MVLSHLLVSVEKASLPDERRFFTLFKQGKIGELEPHFSALPSFYQPFFRQKAQLVQQWLNFQMAKPGLSRLIGGNDWILHCPWQPFAYHQDPKVKDLNPLGEIPLIFLEPLDSVDYDHFLAPYSQKECLLVVETIAHFFQLLQFPELAKIFSGSQHGLYILELYPQTQFEQQNLHWDTAKTFRPILMTDRCDFEGAMPLLEQVLRQCLTQPESEWEKDTPVANWQYTLAKKLQFTREAERYGKNRYIALSIEKGLQNWHDPHKGLPPLDAELGPPPPNYLQGILEEASKTRQPRSFSPKHHIRLAHVVPQIVDGGHAPTRLLKNLCFFADTKWFEVFVLSTERLSEHILEYPIAHYSSLSSNERGKATIEAFKKLGITVWVDSDSSTNLEVAQLIKEILQKIEIDIVVFHGPDEINSWCASSTDVPFRIFFDHGTLPQYLYFDLAILSTQEAFGKNQDRFIQAGMESCFLPFSLDVREGWKTQPYSKEELGLPVNSFVITTISNHLDARLNKEMCQAIGEILQRCPHAVYAPIGKVRDQEKIKAFFAPYGVNDRIIFLGSREHPSQIARSMDLYLNEFPFGSGLALLDAMAAGCPVVSMYDENGPQQARYGATYFGLDYVVKTNRKEDYVDLACRLVQQPDFYQVWSKHALEQYEKRVDVSQYVKTVEQILEQFIDYKRHKKN